MKHIGWITFFVLCLFAIQGVKRSSYDMNARNLLRQNKANGVEIENEVFDNQELRHITSLKEALDKSSAKAPSNIGEQ